MKRLFIILLSLSMLCFCCAACSTQSAREDISGGEQSGEDTEYKEGTMYVYIGGNRLAVAVAESAAAERLIDLLSQDDIIFTVNDYGGFEKVGYLGFELPRSDERISVEPGDIVLYQGNQISMFYAPSSWSYTRIGRMEGYSQSRLRTLLCAGSGEESVRLSLE